MTLLGFFVLATGIFKLFYHGWMLSTQYFLGIGFLLFIIFLVFCKNIDNYYIIDAEQECLFYHFQLFFFKKLRKCLNFSEIAAISVGGRRRSNEESTEWDYQVLLLTKKGQIIALSNLLQNKFDEYEKLAKDIAEMTNGRFIDPEPEKIAETLKDKSGNYSFKFRSATASDAAKQSFGIFLLIIATVAVVAWFLW
jgi:hypothetical protein